ncbi:MAG: hypothetical protein Kapaf2KO_24060 [Candidatus Kapaibacteriales bacterium]
MVNPVPITQSIGIRVLNLSDEAEPITFQFDGQVTTQPLSFGQLSQVVQPPDVAPYDSLVFEGLSPSGEVVFFPPRRPRLVRNVVFTYIVLPSLPNDTIQMDAGRMIQTQTAPSFEPNDQRAYIRLINGLRSRDIENQYSISLRDGCQSGNVITSASAFGLASSSVGVAPGERVITLVVTNQGVETTLGTFSQEFLTQNQYSILVIDKDPSDLGDVQIALLDEEDENSALQQMQPVLEKELRLRTVNLTNEDIDFTYNSATGLLPQIPTGNISEYATLAACQSTIPDTFVLTTSLSGMTSSLVQGLSVGSDYDLAVLGGEINGTDTTELRTLLIEPVPLEYIKKPGHATVRVLNALEGNIGITLSVASNTSQITESGGVGEFTEGELTRNYLAGKPLATSLTYGRLSSPSEVLPGTLPITLFTSAQPATLLGAYIQRLMPDTEYVIYIYGTQDNPKITFTTTSTTSGQLAEPTKGTITQIANLDVSSDNIDVSISSTSENYIPITNAKLSFGNSLATVLPFGTADITAAGKTNSLTIAEGRRTLITVNRNDALLLDMEQLRYTGTEFGRRFINAAIGAGSIDIKEESVKKVFDLGYGQFTENFLGADTRSYVYYASPVGSEEDIASIQDVPHSSRKGYYIILGNSPEDQTQGDPYRFYIFQEF